VAVRLVVIVAFETSNDASDVSGVIATVDTPDSGAAMNARLLLEVEFVQTTASTAELIAGIVHAEVQHLIAVRALLPEFVNVLVTVRARCRASPQPSMIHRLFKEVNYCLLAFMFQIDDLQINNLRDQFAYSMASLAQFRAACCLMGCTTFFTD